jgi:hypothetical protein
VRNAAISRSASPRLRNRGSVHGTRTSGAIRDVRDPPCRRVDRPRGTGVDRAPSVSPRATRYAYRPETDDSHRAIVRADTRTPGPPAAPRRDHRADAPGTRTRPQQRSRPGPSRPAARTGRGRTRSLPGGSGCAHCQHSPDQHEPSPNPKRRTVPACAGLRTWPTGQHRMLSPQQTDTTPKKAGTDTISNHTRRTLND